jgi:hypothetical protein
MFHLLAKKSTKKQNALKKQQNKRRRLCEFKTGTPSNVYVNLNNKKNNLPLKNWTVTKKA